MIGLAITKTIIKNGYEYTLISREWHRKPAEIREPNWEGNKGFALKGVKKIKSDDSTKRA